MLPWVWVPWSGMVSTLATISEALIALHSGLTMSRTELVSSFRICLTQGDQDIAVFLPFCRRFLEHLDLTLADESFQVANLDYYLYIEQEMRPEKGSLASS